MSVDFHASFSGGENMIASFTESERFNAKLAGEIVETDPTVPSWAKEETKPTYTASEVGAQDEPLIGQANSYATDYLIPMRVYNAIVSGRDVVLTYTHPEYGELCFTAWNSALNRAAVTSSSIVSDNGELIAVQILGVTQSGAWMVTDSAIAEADHVHPSELPSGGNAGDFLVKTANGAAWTTLAAWSGGNY